MRTAGATGPAEPEAAGPPDDRTPDGATADDHVPDERTPEVAQVGGAGDAVDVEGAPDGGGGVGVAQVVDGLEAIDAGDAADREDLDGVLIEAPEPPRRVRRPLDVVRLLAAVAGLAAAFLVGAVGVNTVAGVDADVGAATTPLPSPVLLFVGFGSGLLVLLLPVAIVVDLLVVRRLRVLLDGLLAFVAALGVAAGLRVALVRVDGLDQLAASLTGARADAPGVNGFTAGVIALATVAQLGRRPRWRGAAGVVLVLFGIALVSLGSTALAVLVSMLVGRVTGLVVRWAVGTVPSRPAPRAVVAALRGAGVELVSFRPRPPWRVDPSFYDGLDAAGGCVVVHVLDRDHEGAGLLPALWRTLRFREAAGRRALFSLRRALEHEALVSMAMARTGARVQRLLAAVPVDPGGAVLAYDDVPGPTLDEADPATLDDARLDAVWGQVALLHRGAVAHRALTGQNVVLCPDGGAGLRLTPAGLVAAPEAALRVDLVQLLVTFGLVVGPERAVASAARVLGARRLAVAGPLLQPVALLRSTRRALRHRVDLLERLHDRILEVAPSVRVAPVHLERLRPRTIVSAVALTVAAYILVGQVGGLDLVAVVRGADWRWLAVAAVFAAARYVTAAIGLLGFLTERLPFVRTVWVQLATSFLGLVAPAGVGGAALNVRYLQRSGLPAAAAVASVAVWQLGTIVATVGMLVVVAVAGNTRTDSFAVPSTALVVIGAVVAVVVLLVVLVPACRRFVVARARPYVGQIGLRLAAVFSRPARLSLGVLGTVGQAVVTVLVMTTCIDAFGGSLPWSLVAVVVLAGSALGSAAPTPGGLGAVEAVLTAGLTAGGLDGATAVSAVLLFRLLTFWLPVLPGWVTFTLLQRRNLV